jgi:hypothetical protein
MADDISKNISIQISAETDDLEKALPPGMLAD